jgi:subtilase family serine protease
LFGAEVDKQPYSSGDVYAATLPGVVVVSNSWGGGEFNGETLYDGQFTTNSNVAYTFSTGDGGKPGQYPAYSPNVVAIGGTSLETLSLKGTYGYEIGWVGSGGGVSKYEAVPSYQSSNGVNYGARSIPDVSMDADLATGVYVKDSYDAPGGYLKVGGTSLSCPMWAGLIALGDQARGSSLNSTSILSALYGAYNSSSYSTDFHDVTTGNNGFPAGTGYDLVTGIGTPKAPGIVGLFSAPSVIFNTAPPGSINTPAAGSLADSGGHDHGSGIASGATQGTQGHPTSSLYSPQSGTLSNSSLSLGSLTDLVTTMEIPKLKKIGSLLGAE